MSSFWLSLFDWSHLDLICACSAQQTCLWKQLRRCKRTGEVVFAQDLCGGSLRRWAHFAERSLVLIQPVIVLYAYTSILHAQGMCCPYPVDGFSMRFIEISSLVSQTIFCEHWIGSSYASAMLHHIFSHSHLLTHTHTHTHTTLVPKVLLCGFNEKRDIVIVVKVGFVGLMPSQCLNLHKHAHMHVCIRGTVVLPRWKTW